MSISSNKRRLWQDMSLQDQDRVVRMAWEDRTTFDSMFFQFGLTANEVVKFMRTQLDVKGFKRWRRRVTEQGHLKQQAQVEHSASRFKCSRQRSDGSTKGWK
jgi:uncharacterized protein (TIGR03643 family)